MTSEVLEKLRTQLRDIDRRLLLALADRARFPRHPIPKWPAAETRLPPPPLPEILIAISPAGTAGEPNAVEKANRSLIDALLARQQLANQIADAKFDLVRADAREALATGDREKMVALLTDLSAELRLIDFIRAMAAEIATNLPGDLAPFLWREYILPWTRQSEVAHLLEP
ncbi:MAG TPA: hypothetical protein DCM68_05200 [Verrucomicrobia bacterium]|nr:hypothetical protein [Verrucomicrobiota bacterium]